MLRFLKLIRGVFVTVLIVLNLVFFALLILIIYALSFLLLPKWRHYVQLTFLKKVSNWFMTSNRLILKISTNGLWEVKGPSNLSMKNWYIMMSNHQSWIDILALGTVFNYLIPSLKFFMKKELIWQLPLAGLACYVLRYPFVERQSHADVKKNPALKGRDIETTKRACRLLRATPTTLINFIEGTRFTKAKHDKQQSTYQHLLKPRAGGLSIAIQELQDIVSSIVNVTVLYVDKKPTVFEFLSGQFRKVIIHYDVLPITPELIGDYENNREFRAQFQQWLNTVWENKDKQISTLLNQHEK